MNWRTSTVIQLCQAMRESQDYSALPILADALQDAGYPEEGDPENMLSLLRHPCTPDGKTMATRLVALVYSEESAAAVGWLGEFGNRVGYNYFVVVDAGYQFVESGETYRDPEGHNWDASNAVFEDETNEKYWDCFELVTGTRVDSRIRADRAFECPC